ncbi:unnamed protein product [Rhizophagus irregularis]|uniref:NmrA-like domain-containing protein n=1 Tax=Rhizophagus irregularis TaxID=588596 RepID=A0A2I1GVG4_9GLOM|nr:hypothetical protein RhiirA4_406704 [Rhizophagus irregularis]CAB4402470.1 unnamed protein product [Rhizophagus irregularis]
MSKFTIFVSGSINLPARAVVKELNKHDDKITKLRLGLLPGQTTLDLVRGYTEVFYINPSERNTINVALEGVDAAFVWDSELEDKSHLNDFIDIAVEKGVKQLVVLSAYNTNPLAAEDIEKYIISKQIPSYTFLRVPFFTHHLNLYTDSIIKEKVLPLPIGFEGTFSPLDDRDFGEVVATILLAGVTENPYNKMIYTLTGPKLYSGPQLAEKLSIIMNDQIDFRGTSQNEAEAFLMQAIPSEFRNKNQLVKHYLEFYRLIRDGEIGMTTDDVKKIMGDEKSPRDIEGYFGEVLLQTISI